MAIEFGERIRRIPSYPLAAGYDLGPWPTWGDGGFSTETDLLWW